MLPDDVIVVLNLDRSARIERDRRRLSGRPRQETVSRRGGAPSMAP
jgi:hypothetical protein